MFTQLWHYHWQRIIRYFKHRKTAKIITAALFVFIFILVAVAIFYLFKEGFQTFALDPFLVEAMPLYVYELFLLLISALVFISALITAIFGLYKRERDLLIMVAPAYQGLPAYVFMRIFISAIWPLLLIALPALLAMLAVFKIGALSFIIALVAIVLLVAFVTGFALLVVLFFSWLLYKLPSLTGKSWLRVGSLAFLSSLIVIAGLIAAWRRTLAYSDLIALFGAENLDIAQAYVDIIIQQFSIFPSHYGAMVLSLLQQGQMLNAIQALGWLLLLFIASLVLIRFLIVRFLPLWQVMQEGNFQPETVGSNKPHKAIKFPKLFKSQLGAIFEKEALVTIRSTRNLMWLGLLLVIWMMQTGLNFVLGKNIAQHATDAVFSVQTIEALQYMTVVFFISAFVLRFAFPSFSTEIKTAWIIGSAPVEYKKIFWAKFFFYSLIFVAIGLGVGWFNLSVLNLPVNASALLFFYFFLAIVFVNVLGLSLGAIYPNFETDDPQVLSTSLPGLGFMVISMLYGGLGAWLIYQSISFGFNIYSLAYIILSLLVIIWLLRKATNSLSKIEFVK